MWKRHDQITATVSSQAQESRHSSYVPSKEKIKDAKLIPDIRKLNRSLARAVSSVNWVEVSRGPRSSSRRVEEKLKLSFPARLSLSLSLSISLSLSPHTRLFSRALKFKSASSLLVIRPFTHDAFLRCVCFKCSLPLAQLWLRRVLHFAFFFFQHLSPV